MGNSDYSSIGVLWEYLGITTNGALARQILRGRDAVWQKSGSEPDVAFRDLLQQPQSMSSRYDAMY